MNQPRPGFVLVDKPTGITSHGVVARLRRVFGVKRIGHSGTLDPSATGLLICGVGSAARLLDRIKADTKVYVTTGRLGVTTSTLDADGEVTGVGEVPGDIDLEGVVEGFIGEIEQTPPVISAVKIDGERAYARARRGEEVEMPVRRVRIDSIEILDFTPPEFKLRVTCGTGTYIRSLVADIGEQIGCGAHVRKLRRTAIGAIEVDRAVALDEVTPLDLADPAEVLDLPVVSVDDETASRARNGQRIQVDGPEGEVLVVSDLGTVGVFNLDAGTLTAVTVLGN